jgi:hypothetical protein
MDLKNFLLARDRCAIKQLRFGTVTSKTVAFPIPGLGSFINMLAHAPDRRDPGLPGGGRRLVEPVTSLSENQSGSKIAVRLVAGPGQLGMYWAHVTVPDWCSQGVFALRKLVICPRNPGFVT